MATLTLIYTADQAGEFIALDTGKYWDIPEDKNFLRNTIDGQTIISGRKRLEHDWRELAVAKRIVVLTDWSLYLYHGIGMEIAAHLRHECAEVDITAQITPVTALAYLASKHGVKKEIFCVGGKETIEAMAPFASRILATDICNAPVSPADCNKSPLWVPGHIGIELSDSSKCWESTSCEAGSHDNLNWRFVEMKRTMPIEL